MTWRCSSVSMLLLPKVVGRDTPKDAPAGKWRARGRIEHSLLDGEFSVRPTRPKTFARNPTIPHKVTNVSIYDKGPAHAEGYPGSVMLLAEVPHLVCCGCPDVPTGARRN